MKYQLQIYEVSEPKAAPYGGVNRQVLMMDVWPAEFHAIRSACIDVIGNRADRFDQRVLSADPVGKDD